MEANKKKERVYICGPISGRDIEERRRAFGEVKKLLEVMGFEAVNPLENGLPWDAPHEAHMKADFRLLIECDYIYLMNGWSESHGCAAEVFLANPTGIQVLHNEELQDVPGHSIVEMTLTLKVGRGKLPGKLGVDSVKFEEVPIEDEDDTED